MIHVLTVQLRLQMANSSYNSGTALRVLGLCGADDSVHPNMLGIIANAYPFVEFGVLFRPDKVNICEVVVVCTVRT